MTSSAPVRIHPDWVSPQRFAEYEKAAGGDEELASRLYEWNARASSALFEMIHHFEVLLRNAIVRQLELDGPTPLLPPGTPWVQGAKQVIEVERRLTQLGKIPTAGRVYSGLTFGFWKSMFENDYEELWRHSLKFVFRHSRADRPVILAYLESLNRLRNRIAHHGSLVELDVRGEVQKIIRLAGWIDPDAGRWMSSLEQVNAVSQVRPIKPPRNVILVPASEAWELYANLKQNVYVFPAGRSVRVVDHLAFYADQEVKPVVPKILHWFDAIDWSKQNASRLAKTGDPFDKIVAGAISTTKTKKPRVWGDSVYQVFVLSGPRDSETQSLPAAITHSRRGRGSAFAKGQRYHAMSELLTARDTADLALP
ncbi:Abi family protein [Aeromicrobium duanguangcaii]|uniref:Abi family protein n=1 Tax=Aeromicrobium duanguangcaii TaxID=2968086 RepID=A0ABY5KFI6_9ACTN|nr:Abi family protein [Aeromicrobium duanguangcaii]MCD9153691.1 Abi family protein [Aeromicrobium duanguangcaii]UUI69229.1 Abi family protein [Aeromicrobium duanguangcaii]